MYLYDLKGDKIEVYSMVPNMEKIYKFKKEQMESMPVDGRVLKAITNTKSILEDYYTEVDYNDIYYERKENLKKFSII